MPRDYSLYLEDILAATQRIERYTGGLDFTAFSADDMRVDAVLCNLHIVGEAAKQIPQAQRDLAPTVEWRRIAGLRDIIAHRYCGVDLRIVWEIIGQRLPDLQREVAALLAGASSETGTP